MRVFVSSIILLLAVVCSVNVGFSAEIEVKMLNKSADGEKMVFEPMLIIAEKGDTVTFFTN
jgi:plastocyanin